MKPNKTFKIIVTAAMAATVASANAALVAHYAMDGNADDSSGSGLNGSVIGGASYSNDVPVSGGQSLALANNGDPDNQGIRVDGNAALGSGDFTLSYWVKATAFQGNAGLERLTSRGGDAFETAIGDRNAVGGAPQLTLSYYQSTVGWQSTENQIPFSVWTHIAWRNSGMGDTDMELFINGQSVFAGPGVSSVTGDPTLSIGTRHNDVEGFEGLMDDVRLYDSPLTDLEIGALVPEPSTALMGLLGLVLVARRRR